MVKSISELAISSTTSSYEIKLVRVESGRSLSELYKGYQQSLQSSKD